jgi:hypothetical protein
MMGKTRIFAKQNLTRLNVQQAASVLAKRFAQHKQLFSRSPVTVSLEWSISVAMVVVVVCQFALLS